jgi:hypothetical protein
MELRLDYENEFQFQFQLEIVSSGQLDSQQIENAGVPKWEFSGGQWVSATPMVSVSVNAFYHQLTGHTN